MKVLVVSPDRREKGGIATVVDNLQSTEAVTYFYFSTWKNGSSFYRSLYSISRMLLFPFYLLKESVDVVYLHFAHNGSFFRKAYYSFVGKKFKKKIIWHAHSSSFDLFFKGLSPKRQQHIQKIFSAYCDRLIVLGDYWQTFYANEIPVAKEKIIILPNAVFVPKEFQYQPNSQVITMFGRLGKRKGTLDLLEVAEYFRDSAIVFKLYGDGDLKYFTQLIQERGLSKVQIKGWLRDQEKQRAMEEATLNILPSYNEGLPMAILETMALGIPNLATYVGSIDEVISDGSNGLLVSAGDINGMIDKINDFVFEQSKIERNEMSILARKTIEQDFSMEKASKKLAEIMLGEEMKEV